MWGHRALYLSLLFSLAAGHGRLTVPSPRAYTYGGGSNAPAFTCDGPAFGSTATAMRCHDSAPGTVTTVTAGGEVQLEWFIEAGHPGDCSVWISYDAAKQAPENWVKIVDLPGCLSPDGKNLPTGTNKYTLKLPATLPPCEHCVMRWDWYGVQQVVNVEFYVNCFDVKVVGDAACTNKPAPTTKIGDISYFGACPFYNPYNGGFDPTRSRGPAAWRAPATCAGGGGGSAGTTGTTTGTGTGGGTTTTPGTGTGTGTGTGGGGTTTPGTGTGGAGATTPGRPALTGTDLRFIRAPTIIGQTGVFSVQVEAQHVLTSPVVLAVDLNNRGSPEAWFGTGSVTLAPGASGIFDIDVNIAVKPTQTDMTRCSDDCRYVLKAYLVKEADAAKDTKADLALAKEELPLSVGDNVAYAPTSAAQPARRQAPLAAAALSAAAIAAATLGTAAFFR